MIKNKAIFPVCVLAYAVSLSVSAAAETDNSTSGESPGGTLEEVVVTARYKAESVQDTPSAVTAFNEGLLEKVMAQDLRDVSPSTPNVRIQPVNGFNNSANIYMRGIGHGGIESTEEPRVGLSIDGVVLTRPVGSLIDLFDVDRIEVLRGPTGTTFGKNSMSGGIAITTKRPSGEFDYKAEVAVGNYGRKDLRVAVDMPIITDKLAARVSVLDQNYDGHFVNRVNGEDLGGEDVRTIRTSVLWTPTENIDATLIAWDVKDRSDAPGAENDPDPGQLLQFTETDDDPYTVGSDAPNFANLDQTGVTGIVNWDLNGWVLTSVTGFSETDDFTANDFDHTEIPMFPTSRIQEHDQFSQELRLATQLGEKLDLVAGLFYLTQEHEIVQNFPTLGPSADYTTQDSDSKAVFAQAIYGVTDKLSATLGARYSKESKDYMRNPGVFFADITTDPNSHKPISLLRQLTVDELATGSTRIVTGELDSSRLTTKFGLDYQFNEDMMAYFSFAEGYKAGEFGARASSPITVGPTDDESSESFEIGLKSEWFDNRLRLNVAAFYTEYEDLQVSVFLPSNDNPTGQESALSNIAGATTKGLEVELFALPHERLTLQASVGLLDAEYTDFCADLNGPSVVVNPVSECGDVVSLPNGAALIDEDHSDRDLARAPELEAYLAAEYVQPLGNGFGELTARVSWSYMDEFNVSGGVNPKSISGNVTKVDASLVWLSEEEKVRVSLWGKNLTDKAMVTGFIETAQFFNQKFYGEPRTYGLSVSLSY